MSNVPRMRTLPEAVREIKNSDKNTALTVTALRRMVDRGEIPYIRIASKRLICLDTLLDILQNPIQKGQAAEQLTALNGGKK